MKTKLFIGLLLIGNSLVAAELDKKFLNAIHQVETGGRLGPISGDNGKALGPYQIHKVYWLDVAKQVGGKYEDVANKVYAEKVVTAYLNKYARKAIAGKDYETLARIHNGGPSGAKKSATKNYWQKVKMLLN